MQEETKILLASFYRFQHMFLFADLSLHQFSYLFVCGV